MKKALILVLLLIGLAIIVPVISLAETVAEKPKWPAGYETWPNKNEGSCQIKQDEGVSMSAFVRTFPKEKRVEVVLTLTQEKNLFFATHAIGTKNAPDFIKSYIKTNTKWLDIDNLPKGDLILMEEFKQKNQKLNEYVESVMTSGDCGEDNIKGFKKFWEPQFEFESGSQK